jgi:hypothetical protein
MQNQNATLVVNHHFQYSRMEIPSSSFLNDLLHRERNDSCGAIHDGSHTLSDTASGESPDDEKHLYSREDTDTLTVNIYRYKFTEEFMEELYQFSKIHQYDHRKDFKEAWANWIQENEEIVSQEVKRITELGYEGDVPDKMFKSARYYFRKKSTEKKAPQTRRAYVGTNRDLLEKMDQHIQMAMKRDDYKPSDDFCLFCKENVELLREEVARLCNLGFTNPIEIQNKIKKTYKNRYFIIIHK